MVCATLQKYLEKDTMPEEEKKSKVRAKRAPSSETSPAIRRRRMKSAGVEEAPALTDNVQAGQSPSSESVGASASASGADEETRRQNPCHEHIGCFLR